MNKDDINKEYCMKDVDGDGGISVGDKIALLAIIGAANVAAADFNFA